jgi:phosphomannomutase
VLNKKIARINDADGYKFICEDESWLMLRLSGTEPILRIYAESPGEKRALEMLEFGKKLAEGV